MILSRKMLSFINSGNGIRIPTESSCSLPEKVLQFGSGVLLRGLPDYFIDQANQQGIFNGRVVVVKSTQTGDIRSLARQDYLYTHCIRGIRKGVHISEIIINASLSRVLSAEQEWDQVLLCAQNPELKVILSNTTEVGIALVDTDRIPAAEPPVSFPGKLLAFLWERFCYCQGNPDWGLVIVPTELIPENGKQLQSIVLALARSNQLGSVFTDWLIHHHHFCNSLVDRIVPGLLPEADRKELEAVTGYQDDQAILSEPYALWAIETTEPRVREILSFAGSCREVILAPDIRKYRELKLRLLNGTHTFCCGLALEAGFKTVKEAMEDPAFRSFIKDLMQLEIAKTLESEELPGPELLAFVDSVLDRFSNPYLEHGWLTISLQYTSKMRMRNLPLIQGYIERFRQIPERMAFGFASYLMFMRPHNSRQPVLSGENPSSPVRDDWSNVLEERLAGADTAARVAAVLGDENIWGTDLRKWEGWETAVGKYFNQLSQTGVRQLLQRWS